MAFYRKRNGAFGEVGSNSFYVRDGGIWKVAAEIKSKQTGAWARGFINEIAVQATAAASLNVSSLFDPLIWASTTPKRVSVPSGVTMGPLSIDSSMQGTLNIDNDGEILGLGGAVGAAGGDAITNSTTGTVIINNTGLIAGGGGGGGTGGQGSTSSIVYIYSNISYWRENPGQSDYIVKYYNSTISSSNYQIVNYSSVGNPPTYRGSLMYQQHIDGNDFDRRWQVGRYQTQYHNGGAGGVGQGYLQSASSGSGGGSNAGTGGTGGSYATAGASGSNGNYSGGSTGGAAGAAVSGNSVTMNNTGTVEGTF